MELRLDKSQKLLEVISGTTQERNYLQQILTVTPQWYYFQKSKYPNWDGKIEFIKSEKFISFGMWDFIREMFKKRNFPLQFLEINNFFNTHITSEHLSQWLETLPLKYELRPYQFDALLKQIRSVIGIIKLPTGAGKSYIQWLLFRWMLDHKQTQKCLMIVPNKSLCNQFVSDVQDYEELFEEKTIVETIFYGGSKKQNSVVTVGTYQSLINYEQEFFNQFNLVQCDETHTAKCKSVSEILTNCRAKYRFGCTGTLWKKKSWEGLTLQTYLGPYIFEKSLKEITDLGFLTPFEVHQITLNYSLDKKQISEILDKNTIKQLKNEKDHIIIEQKRTEILLGILHKKHDQTKNTLLFFNKRELGKTLFDSVSEKYKKVYYIDGSTKLNDRELIWETLRNTTGNIAVVSFGTCAAGINCKKIDSVFLMESFTSFIMILQSIGRSLRLHKSKSSVLVIDFIDNLFKKNILSKQGLSRTKLYTKEQIKTKEFTINL